MSAASRQGPVIAAKARINAQVAQQFGRTGRFQEALPMGLRAAKLFRQAVKAGPSDYRSELAGCLVDLGLIMVGVGELREALRTTRKAIAIYRQLTSESSGRFRIDLANALTNLAAQYARLGRLPDSVVASEEAIKLSRRVSGVNSDPGSRSLARALNNRAAAENQLNELERALATVHEAVPLWRHLASGDPSLLPDLAISLDCAATVLAKLGRPEDAVGFAIESTAIYKRVVSTNPAVLTRALGRALLNRSSIERALRRPADSLVSAREAVDLLHSGAPFRGAEDDYDYARALATMASSLGQLSRHLDALPFFEQALETFRRCGALPRDIAVAENNLASAFISLGRHNEARGLIDSSIRTLRNLAEADREASRPDLAFSLGNLVRVMAALDHHDEAHASAGEVVAIYRDLALESPSQFEPHLAEADLLLAMILVDLNRPSEGAAAAQEAVELYRHLAKSNPKQFEPQLLTAWWGLGMTLDMAGDLKGSIVAQESARTLGEVLFLGAPDRFRAELTNIYETTALLLRKLGRHREASQLLAREEELLIGTGQPPNCIFCGSRADSREHVYSRWMKKMLPRVQRTRTHFRTRSAPPDIGSSIGFALLHRVINEPVADTKIPCVCTRCNNDWMGQLDERVKPLLKPLIRGEPAQLTTSAMALIATWAAMKAMVWEFHDPGTRTIPVRHHHYLYRHRKPPPRTSIWIAPLAGPEWLDNNRHEAFLVAAPGAVPTAANTHQTTIGFGHLLVSVIGTTYRALRPPPLEEILPGRIRMIWPRCAEVNWPPGPELSDHDAWQVSGALGLSLGSSEPPRPDWMP